MNVLLDLLRIPIVWVLIILSAVLLLLDSMDSDDFIIRKEAQHYCEMVDLYNESKGENGWPDYRASYASDC